MDDEKLSLVSPIEELETRILESDDISELNSIINIFNLNIQKQNILRNSKLSQLQDMITDEISDRIQNQSVGFTNQDLLTYFKTIQDTLTKSDNTLNKIDVPAIQFNQNNVNINVADKTILNRDSRRKVLEAINSMLQNNQEEAINISQNDVQEIIES